MNLAIRHVGLAAAGILGLSAQAFAATKSTTIVGTMSKTQETALQGLTNAVGDGENAMYNGGPPADPLFTPLLGFGEVTGPYNHISYYDSVASPQTFQTTISGSARLVYPATQGDAKISQNITGSITIDDGGNGFGAGDLISGTLTLTSSGSGSIVRVMDGATVVDKYDSMTQVIPATAATTATANGFGGFDYVIGSGGFPTLLTFSQAGACFGLTFGAVDCGHSFTAFATSGTVDPDFWNGSSVAGLGSLEGNNGVKTTGSVTNLQCIDGRSSTGVESLDCLDSKVSFSPWIIGPCAAPGGCTGNESTPGSVRGSAEDVSWDNLVIKVSTNGVGAVVAVAGFNVDDYAVFGPNRCGDNTTGTLAYSAVCNSWSAGYFTAQSPDGDGDGFQNSLDNCSATANPTQLDANGDGYGNICDADLNNSNLTTSTDFNLLRSVLNQSAGSSALAAAADMNGSGLVTSTDFNLLRARLNTAPGPSGFK